MTVELAPAPAPLAAAPPRPRIFSGIQPSGIVHLGNDLGAIRNYVMLQYEYEAIYCIVDYHALTSTHDPELMRRRTREMAAGLLALGLDPDRCTLFVQSHRPEHAELAWLLCTVTPVSWLERTPTYKDKIANQPDDVNHGLLTYPVLQAADIIIYKASMVPVGKDQAAHLELAARSSAPSTTATARPSRSRRPSSPRRPSCSGPTASRRCRKSIGNTIDILGDPDLVRRQVMCMVTDTQAVLRSDPGRPEVCNVCQLHRFFGDDYEEIWDGERTARTGCVDTKKLLAERITRHYAGAARALRGAHGQPGRGGRDPGGGRGPPQAHGRGDDGRGQGEDGPALEGRPDGQEATPAAPSVGRLSPVRPAQQLQGHPVIGWVRDGAGQVVLVVLGGLREVRQRVVGVSDVHLQVLLDLDRAREPWPRR